MIRKNMLILMATGTMVLPQIGMAQFGPKPGQPQQIQKPGQPQPPNVVKPGQPTKPQPQPPQMVKPGQPQPPNVVKPGQPTKPQPQPSQMVKPSQPQPPNVVKPGQPVKPQPQPPQVQKPAPLQPVKPVPAVEYRPGHKNHPLQPPKERAHYKDWKPVKHKQFYKLNAAPGMMQVSMRVGQEVEFKLEEKIGDGLRWFARYDSSMVDVDVEHEGRHWYNFGRTAHSEVEIEAHRPGNTMVELVYARPNEWDRGDDPLKVVQIFVHVE